MQSNSLGLKGKALRVHVIHFLAQSRLCGRSDRQPLPSAAGDMGCCTDISRLRVDATIFGATRSFKTDGDGRGFIGCSQLLSGAGPVLPHFIVQQREMLREELLHTALRKDPASAYAVATTAVDALRRGLVEFANKVVPSSFGAPYLVPSYEEAVNMSPTQLADLAVRVGSVARTTSEETRTTSLASSRSVSRRLHASGMIAQLSSSLSVNDSPYTATSNTNGGTEPLPPRRLAPPGAVMLTPGFNLPSSFLVQVVEPNAVLSNQQMLESLFRLEEREAAKRRERRELAGGTSRDVASLSKGRGKSRVEAERGDCSGEAQVSSHSLDDVSDGEGEIERGWLQMRLLEDCYVNALNAAAALGVQSVAVPCLGAGVGRFPVHVAARCAARGVARWLTGEQLRMGKGTASPHGEAGKVIQRIAFCTTCDQEWNALRRLVPRFLS